MSNITNPTILIIILFILGIFSTGLIIFSGDLAANPNNKLNQESKNFVYEQYGFDVEEVTINDTENLFYIIDNNETTASTKDYTLEFQFFRESSGDFRGVAQQIYDIPSFLISSFQLDRDNWSWVINSFNFLTWWIIFFAIYKLLRGIIK